MVEIDPKPRGRVLWVEAILVVEDEGGVSYLGYRSQ